MAAAASPAERLPLLATERLQLRPVGYDDLPLLIALNSDPAVMAHIRGRAATAEETEDEWRQRLERQSSSDEGLGYWLGFEDGCFVGWWSASWFASRPDTAGLGYRLSTHAWGRGLAAEGARATIAQAFRNRHIERVWASTMAVNLRSRRVLEKIGMTHTSSWVEEWEEPIEGSEHGEVGYELTREQWARASTTPPPPPSR